MSVPKRSDGRRQASHGARSLTDHVWVKSLLEEFGPDGCWPAPYRQVTPGAWFTEKFGERGKVGIRRYMYAGYYNDDPGAGMAYDTTCVSTSCCNPKHLKIMGSAAKGDDKSERAVTRGPGRPRRVEGKLVSPAVMRAHVTAALINEYPRINKDVAGVPSPEDFVTRARDDRPTRFDLALYRGIAEIVCAAWDADDEDKMFAEGSERIWHALNDKSVRDACADLEDTAHLSRSDDERREVLEVAAALGIDPKDPRIHFYRTRIKPPLFACFEPADDFVLSCAGTLGITLV